MNVTVSLNHPRRNMPLGRPTGTATQQHVRTDSVGRCALRWGRPTRATTECLDASDDVTGTRQLVRRCSDCVAVPKGRRRISPLRSRGRSHLRRPLADLINPAREMADNRLKSTEPGSIRPRIAEVPLAEHAGTVARIGEHFGHGHFARFEQLPPLCHRPGTDARRVSPCHQCRAGGRADRLDVIVLQPNAFRVQPIQVWRLEPRIPVTRHVAVALVVGDDQDHVGPGVLSLCVRRGGYARDNDRPGQDCAR